MSNHLRAIGSFSLLCLAVVMTACAGTARVEQKSTEAVSVTHPSRVVVETYNGNIDVVIGADDKVSAEVTRFTDPGLRDALQNIEFTILQDAQTVSLKARWPDGTKTSPGSTGADLKVSIPAGSPVQAVAGNGKITYRGALGQGGYGFKTGNGPIVLTLPAEAQFAVNATVGNGRITSEFPLSTGTSDSRVVRGKVGNQPEASIIATTGNGRIELRREN